MEQDNDRDHDHQGSLANNGESNTNSTKQGIEGSRSLCIMIKLSAITTTNIAVSHTNDNNDHEPHVCNKCHKAFDSAKALGGHMRVHSLSSKKSHDAKQGTQKNNNALEFESAGDGVVGGNNPICNVCKRAFPSMKSLSGHMRSHPERVWRGIQPPPPPEDSSSTISSTLLKGWSVTAKRGSKGLSSSCSSSTRGCSSSGPLLEHGDGIEREVVNHLMLLANQHGNGTSKDVGGDDQAELSPVPPFKKLKIEEKASSPEEGSMLDSRVSNCSNVGTNINKKSKERGQKKKGIKKMKSTELGKAEQKSSNLDNNGRGKRCHQCRICNKSFPSYQALGGHLSSSHRRSKNTQIKNESESDDVSAPKEEKEEITTTMQEDEIAEAVVVDDTQSQRPHSSGMTEAHSAQAITPVENVQNCPKILNFDLNLPPAMDEEEGLQSELFNHSYASSSSYSVTN